jgi:hypothetical protein
MTTPAENPRSKTENSAVDPRPIVGPEITLRIGLTPALITLTAAPITVLLTMLLAWFLLKTLAIPLHAPEMLAAALINGLAGIAAALPLLLRMKRGAIALAQAGLIAIGIRMGLVLLGLIAAIAPAWHLDREPLILWVIAFYFPLLITESTLVAWLIKKAKH